MTIVVELTDEEIAEVISMLAIAGTNDDYHAYDRSLELANIFARAWEAAEEEAR